MPKRLKVVVDYALCEANGLCVEAAPEVFAFDEGDNLRVLEKEPGEALRESVEKAVRVCPKAALRVGGVD